MSKNLKIGKILIRLAFWPIVLYLCLLTLLISLGFWQLDRAEEKRQFLNMEAQRLNVQSIIINAEMNTDLTLQRYRKAKATGHYDIKHQFLLDNQIYQGKAGFLVLTPFILNGSDTGVLVNRGWLPLNIERSNLPKIDFDSKFNTISGRINAFPSVGIKLEGGGIPTENWPSVVQFAVPDKLAEKLGYALLPFQLELDPGEANGYTRDWQARQIMPVEKHIAYAMQWFGLALTLTVLIIWISCKKNKHD